tara:strand:+ start:1331 stop:4801 length:3471 start_codon:yes stop_codon:yes gene_type:complete
MEKKDLQKLLSQPYKQDNWKQIVQFVFPNVSILSSPKEFPINNEKIKKFRQIGSVRLNDGKNLALFELLLADTVNIQRNRVELNNEISKYIDQEQIHGVLSVFEQGTDDYRFTFSARSTEFDEEESDFIQKKTDTKRYTYVLGKNESCKTPADRFYKLSENKSEVDINAIQNAFSVEQLSKEFFDKYKKQFEKFWKYIASKEEYNGVFINGQGEREVKIRNFTKKLLGRIVFLHFLQKKGWMGCPENELWGAGDKKFMQNLFKDFTHKEQFHSKCLVELFYNTLNAKRDDQLFSCEGLEGALNNSKVPYLNGGLFDSDKLESKKIDFPESYFEDLFDFFGQYNFTIDENDPNDHEVGIDPEMLGHIFENLLEDNKDKGAFYTPKVIVQYMCQESLIEYLATKLEAETSDEVKQAIEDLIRNRLAEEISDLDLVEPIAQALFDVKICDPAIGSGAFPMGILNVIYQVIEALYYLQPDSVARVWNISDTKWQPHLVKKNIIQHSIYGVDIESGAVDIARLRFWLALVVDEVEPLPLPNLDYKIMQGDSLLESFEGIDLSQISDATAYEAVYESEQIELFSGEAKKKVSMSLQFEDVKTLMDDYFNANDPETKKDLHKRIDDQVLNHIRFTLAEHKRELQKKAKKLEKKVSLDEAAARTWEQKEKIRTNSKDAKALVKLNTELSQYNDKEIKLAQLSNSNERPFFLWHLFFQEIFDEGGFDIVIGNPPYIQLQSNNGYLAEMYKNYHFKTFERTGDIYALFYEAGLNFLKKDGVLTYITSNKWMKAAYGKSLRKLFSSYKVLKVIDLGAGVFETATVDTNILTLKKRVSTFNSAHALNLSKESKLKSFEKYRDSWTILNDLNEGMWNILTLSDSEIKKKIEKVGKPLIDWDIQFYRGILTGLNEAFIINNSEKNRLCQQEPKNLDIIKPLLRGKDIIRYNNKWAGLWLITSHNGYKNEKGEKINAIDIDNYPKVKEHLNQYFLKLKKRGDKGITPYNLRNCAYQDHFEHEKIVYSEISQEPCFYFDENRHYISNTAYILTGKKLKYLNGLLNSKLVTYAFSNFYSISLGKTGYRYLAQYMDNLPIPDINGKTQNEIENLVCKIIEGKKNGFQTNNFENRIDDLIYRLYDLTYSEVLFIEPNFNERLSKKAYEALEVVYK